MINIKEMFITKTIPDFMSWEYNMPYIRFVFDEEALNDLKNTLDERKFVAYDKGIKAIKYLRTIKKEWENRKDKIYIVVHDSSRFFSLLQELVNIYSKGHSLAATDSFLRSIWLRIGVEDINDVEGFLRRQLSFLKNDNIFKSYEEIDSFSKSRVLAYKVQDNEEYFETNKNIVFSIRDSRGDVFEGYHDYDFPAIHFGLTKIDNKPTCYIYGIQKISGMHDENIKNDLQNVRKKMRNKYVSADFLIAISLFFDYLYDNQIYDVVIPPLQVFNYPYHEQLSKSVRLAFDSYSDEDKKHLEELYDLGDRSDKVLDYMHTKSVVDKFVDKEDIISKNKTERFIYMFYELQRLSPSFEIISDPLIQGENLIIRLHGKSNILNGFEKDKDSTK